MGSLKRFSLFISLIFILKCFTKPFVVVCRKIPNSIWVHVAAVWNEEERLGSVFLNGKPKGRQNVKDGKSSYRAMNNSHSVYIIGAESKTNAESGGKTLHGFIKELKVSKRALNQSEILTEATLSNASGTFDCLVFVIIYLF